MSQKLKFIGSDFFIFSFKYLDVQIVSYISRELGLKNEVKRIDFNSVSVFFQQSFFNLIKICSAAGRNQLDKVKRPTGGHGRTWARTSPPLRMFLALHRLYALQRRQRQHARRGGGTEGKDAASPSKRKRTFEKLEISMWILLQ